jgi:hypothetical protein
MGDERCHGLWEAPGTDGTSAIHGMELRNDQGRGVANVMEVRGYDQGLRVIAIR